MSPQFIVHIDSRYSWRLLGRSKAHPIHGTNPRYTYRARDGTSIEYGLSSQINFELTQRIRLHSIGGANVKV